MDLKDRYYWKKYEEIMSDEIHPYDLTNKPRKHRAAFIFLLYFSLLLALFVYSSDFSLITIKKMLTTNIESNTKEHPISSQKPLYLPAISQPTPVAIPKPLPQVLANVVLHADRNGHYRGTLLVNNIAMPFLVDTGATQTVIPQKMAYAARLPIGKAFQASTANGFVVEHSTRINSLKIGNLDLKGLDASINDHLDEVLIGMSTLKLFHMTQDRDTLTLSAYADELAVMNSSAAEAPVRIAKKTWVKTVTCDNNNEYCKTSYR